jgi:hypothetical protein
MKKILFAASSNGLGHARRLSFLYNEILQRGLPAGFILTKSQYLKCKSEILESTNGEIIISDSKNGLDGPHSSLKASRENISVLKKVSEADFVLSDNLIWPATYNANVYLHGHFTWVDYWEQLGPLDSDLTQLAIEKELKEKIIGWFKPDAFGLSSSFLSTKVIPMPLIRYPRDVAFRAYERNWAEIWVSIGTTSDHQYGPLALDPLKELEGLGFQIKILETYQFHNLEILPGLVIGRPGLGTIRDCLASGTPFFDLKELTLEKVSDPELRSNVSAMERLGLLISKEALCINSLMKLSSRYTEFWNSSSTEINQYVDKILASLSRNGS